MKGEKQGEKKGKSSWNHGTLYAGDSSVLDFWVSQVMGEIVSAAQLINRSAGSIYLCLRQSCWEMGTVKWESTAYFSSPQLPSGHFTPPALLSKATCEERLINIKQVESRQPLPSAFHHNSRGHFNVFCPNLKGTRLSRLSYQNSLEKMRYDEVFISLLKHPLSTTTTLKAIKSRPPSHFHSNFAYFIYQIRGFYTLVMAGVLCNKRWDRSYFYFPILDNCPLALSLTVTPCYHISEV